MYRLASPIDRHNIACRVCAELAADCGCKPILWRTASIVAALAGITKKAELDDAIDYGHCHGWLHSDNSGNICLTVKGARLFKPATHPSEQLAGKERVSSHQPSGRDA